MPSRGDCARFIRRRAAKKLAGLAAAAAFIAEANAPALSFEVKVNVPQPKINVPQPKIHVPEPKIHLREPSVVVRTAPSLVTKQGNSSSKGLDPSLSAAMQKGLAGKLNKPASGSYSSTAVGSKTASPTTFSVGSKTSGRTTFSLATPLPNGGQAVGSGGTVILSGQGAGRGIAGQGITISSLQNAQSTLQNDLDSDNEISEMGSMQLQMLMDSRSKLLDTASDIEKTKSDTDNAISGNIKQ